MRTDTPLRPIEYDRRHTSTVWECLTPRPHSQRMLADFEVREIRHLYATGRHSQRALGRLYNVSRETIYRVVNAISYKEIAA